MHGHMYSHLAHMKNYNPKIPSVSAIVSLSKYTRDILLCFLFSSALFLCSGGGGGVFVCLFVFVLSSNETKCKQWHDSFGVEISVEIVMRKLKTSTLSILLHPFICWALNIHDKIYTYQHIRFLMYLNKICTLELINTNAHHTTGNRSWTCALHVCRGGGQKTPRMYLLCSEIPCCAVDSGNICAICTFWLSCIQSLRIPMSNVKLSLIRSNERPIHEFQAWELSIQKLSIQQNFTMHDLWQDPSTSIQTLNPLSKSDTCYGRLQAPGVKTPNFEESYDFKDKSTNILWFCNSQDHRH